MKWKFTIKTTTKRLTAADKSWADILFNLLGFNTDPCILQWILFLNLQNNNGWDDDGLFCTDQHA